MDIKIYYCKPWGYNIEASRIEDELTSNFNKIKIQLIEGKFRQFTIYLNDKKIYNKTKCIDRFPKEMEITNLIRRKIN